MRSADGAGGGAGRALVRALAVVALAAAGAVASCAMADRQGTDGATHWLRGCATDDDCGKLACLCGICTRPCEDGAACADLGEGASCGAVEAGRCVFEVCVAPCSSHADCAPRRSTTECVDGTCWPRTGSRPDAAVWCAERGLEPLAPGDFILDLHTRLVDPEGAWIETNRAYLTLVPDCGDPRGPEWCGGPDHYVARLFRRSDTTVAGLGGWPAFPCGEERTRGCGSPLETDAMAASRDAINALAASERVVGHAVVVPNTDLEQQLAMMERAAAEHGVAAWLLFPAWGPEGVGYWLDDPEGIAVIEKGIELGVPVFIVDKGPPIPGFDVTYNFPDDVPRVARRYPEASFVVDGAALCAGQANFCISASEGPYQTSPRGIDTLISALLAEGIGPNENVHAALSNVIPAVMDNPEGAAHVLGKLLLHVGEDNVLWATRRGVAASPQELIEAFRTLTLPEALRAEHGYPELTAERRRKVFGLNAARLLGVDPQAVRCRPGGG